MNPVQVNVIATQINLLCNVTGQKLVYTYVHIKAHGPETALHNFESGPHKFDALVSKCMSITIQHCNTRA